jgi:hypothetical protein
MKKEEMDKRTTFIKEFRGDSIGKLTNDSTFNESFQNEVLRPILKLQNDLLLVALIDYIYKNKIDFNLFRIEKKIEVIENLIHKDFKFQNLLKGMIVGLFTVEEYEEYSKNSSSINKRIMVMLKDRFKSQVHLLTLNSI